MLSVAQGRASARLRKKGCKPGWEVLHMQKSTENQTSEGVSLFFGPFSWGVSEDNIAEAGQSVACAKEIIEDVLWSVGRPEGVLSSP